MMKIKKATITNTTVSLRLGRASGGSGGDWHLSIGDEPSSLMILELRLSDEDLGKLLGCSGVTAEAEVMHSSMHGKKLETQIIDVPCGKKLGQNYSESAWRKSVEAYMTKVGLGSWEPDIDPGYSFKRHDVAANYYRVVIRRWVPRPSRKE